MFLKLSFSMQPINIEPEQLVSYSGQSLSLLLGGSLLGEKVTPRRAAQGFANIFVQKKAIK